MSAARPTTLEDRLADLGNIPLNRICHDPAPGSAGIEDLLRRQSRSDRLYELVDGTLVEKAMDWQESLLAGVLLQWLNNYLDQSQVGVATGPDGMTRLFGDTIRSPDVAFISWERLPGKQLPTDPIPALAPNFVIEVLSVGNTYSEMSRKRREYFHAGVQLVWMVHARERSITVYRDPQTPTVFEDGDSIDASPVLAGWHLELAALFSKLDR